MNSTCISNTDQTWTFTNMHHTCISKAKGIQPTNGYTSKNIFHYTRCALESQVPKLQVYVL